jgi:AcrR family transcriptional regulator
MITQTKKAGRRSPASRVSPAATRAEKVAERRDAILSAALDEFASRGFAATRLDDIASRAGVAKGTIYLHFKDKEQLFLELVRTEIVPRVQQLSGALPDAVPTRAVFEGFVQMFVREVLPTRRADIIRLVITEGRNLPAVAEFYYREVIQRGMAAMSKLVERGIARGEISNRGLAQYPQVMIGPALVAIIWKSLFEKHAPLDVEAMLKTHVDLIFGSGRPA